MTNTSKDSRGSVRIDTTRIIDTSGDQYRASLINAARDNAPLSLVKDVPIKISATFMDVPTSVQDIALFEIAATYDLTLSRVLNGQLRNIKITESKMGNSPSPVKKKK